MKKVRATYSQRILQTEFTDTLNFEIVANGLLWIKRRLLQQVRLLSSFEMRKVERNFYVISVQLFSNNYENSTNENFQIKHYSRVIISNRNE